MPDTRIVAGKPAHERLMQQIQHERRRFVETDPPSASQVAMVLHALADHTAIMTALQYRREDGPWPEATSIGRWLHDVGDDLEDLQ